MRFILMMHAPRGTGNYQINSWTPDALSSHMQFMMDLNKDLRENGEWVDGQGLAAPKDARIVRADAKGQPVVSDGPFAESKEFLAGYWIVDVENASRAHAIAGRASTAPGPDGKPLNMPIEVREVLSIPATQDA
jgi:hypothetical protein